MFILAVISIIIFLAIFCSKWKQAMPATSGLQQEMLKENDSVTPHQLQLEDYEVLLEMKSNVAYIPNAQQVLIETEDNVAHYIPIENEYYYSNDQCDYEEIQDY